jgi:hypothetical protein
MLTAELNPSTAAIAAPQFVDRRSRSSASSANSLERRQFTNSYRDLSPDAKELAEAIDSYKIHHRRRYINFEEMLQVITSLGYRKEDS